MRVKTKVRSVALNHRPKRKHLQRKMASSAPASPRGTPQGIGFGDRSPSSQRRSKLRRRSSSSDSSSSGEDTKPCAPRKHSGGLEDPHDDDGGEKESKEAIEDKQAKVTLSPTLQKLTRSIKTMVDRSKPVEKKPEEEKQKKEEVDHADDVNDRERERSSLPRKLSVAALIRSFSPRSRAKANKTDAAVEPKEETVNPAEDGTPANREQKTESKKKTRITFGTLKRASLSFPTSPPREPRRASHASVPSSAGSDTPLVVPPPLPPPPTAILPAPLKPTSTSTISKWKQAVNAVPKDPSQLKIQIPPSLYIPPRVSLPPVSVVVEDESFATGPGSLVDDVRSTLAKLVELLDGVNPRKLLAIRLGGELRGLLGKAADEVEAYAEAFRDHARASVGVAIALQNLAASLQQVFPIVEKLRTAKFMLNRQFKREVTFAFQEINSYYTSLFMELSMAVAMRAGVVLPLPAQVAPPLQRQEEEEDEEEDEVKPEEIKKATTPTPLAPISTLNSRVDLRTALTAEHDFVVVRTHCGGAMPLCTPPLLWPRVSNRFAARTGAVSGIGVLSALRC
jgi:hypothetical protein